MADPQEITAPDAFHRFVAESLRKLAVGDAEAARGGAFGPHVAGDDELLDRWSGGYLPPNELAAVQRHLAHCPECLREICDLIECGVLLLPQQLDVAENTPAPSRLREWRRLFSIGIVGAAAAAAAVLLVLWRPTPVDIPRQLELARLDLAENRAEQAFARLETLRRDAQQQRRELTSEEMTDWQSTTAEAAALAAERFLDESIPEVKSSSGPPGTPVPDPGKATTADRTTARPLPLPDENGQDDNFVAAGRIVRRANELSVSNERLANIQLQAQAGMPTVSLARYGLIADYPQARLAPASDVAGGSSRSNTLDGWTAALEQYPNSRLLRLNYGQRLLWHGKHQEALSQFQQLLLASPDDADALLGQGLAHYGLGQLEEALQAFERRFSLASEDWYAPENAATVLDALKKPEDAQFYRERAERRRIRGLAPTEP